MIEQPIHFAPYLKSVIWGGERIAPYKGITTTQEQIGESWELSAVPGHVSVVDRGPLAGKTLTELIDEYKEQLVGKPNYEKYGNNFPLLVKLIDARADLSVQVHPDDELAFKRHNCPGKTEMWHIIETAPDARIYAGLSEQITPDEYEKRVADNTIMDVIAGYDSTAGDTFYLPAGRIHAIGAGNLLAEIQQTSDITYRIYDYDRRDKDGNPRELHTEQARDAIDYTVYPTYKSDPVGDDLANCKYFDVRRMNLSSVSQAVNHDRDSFTIIMCLHGEGEINYSGDAPVHIRQGETLLFPATMTDISASGLGELITVQS
ncbi:MAG: mannose-6-phosphate isomerase [Muribaculaceae bacterium]|nr:mannose-6-phosphate isomerase [Muribaculaceae bacterium]